MGRNIGSTIALQKTYSMGRYPQRSVPYKEKYVFLPSDRYLAPIGPGRVDSPLVAAGMEISVELYDAVVWE